MILYLEVNAPWRRGSESSDLRFAEIGRVGPDKRRSCAHTLAYFGSSARFFANGIYPPLIPQTSTAMRTYISCTLRAGIPSGAGPGADVADLLHNMQLPARSWPDEPEKISKVDPRGKRRNWPVAVLQNGVTRLAVIHKPPPEASVRNTLQSKRWNAGLIWKNGIRE
jgi:hypothetical protein